MLKLFRSGVLLAGVLIFGAAVRSMAQGGPAMHREVQVAVAERLSPVAVTKVAFRGAVVQKGRFVQPAGAPQDLVTPFVAGGDWIQGLTVYILNRTDKPIAYLDVAFGFPETRDYVAHTEVGCSIDFGRVPASALFDERGRPVRLGASEPARPFRIGPGETAAVQLSDHMDAFMKQVDRFRPLAGLTQMTITPQPGVFFEDGMRWSGGYRTFDPRTSAWRRMGPDYFPGDMDRYLPGKPGWIDQK